MVVRWLSFAQDQLKDIVQYVIDNFGEMTAKKALRRILDDTETLGKYPTKGIYDKKFSKNGIEVRHLNIGPNMVYYLIDEDEVVVIAVMHYRQSVNTINRAIRYAIGKYKAE